jgi:hypothetical protein
VVAATDGSRGGGEVAEKPKQEHRAAQEGEAQKKEKSRKEEQDQGGHREQQGGGQADTGGDENVIFRVTGDPSIKFQGSISTTDKQRSVQSVRPQDCPLKDVDTGMFSTDIVSGNTQNMTSKKAKLTVQIVVDGKVEKQASTTTQYGIVQVNWST